MSKRLTRTGIEYGELNWSFYPGCKHGVDKCPVSAHCWARAMSKRQGRNHNEPHLVPELLLAPLHVKKPSTILVNFMGDLMGDWVDPYMAVTPFQSLQLCVFEVMKRCPHHRFLFLTKNPEGYKRWGDFPGNAWLGASVWNEETMIKALYALTEVKAGGRWLSIEPMLGPVVPKVWPAEWDDIGWVVIGGATGTRSDMEKLQESYAGLLLKPFYKKWSLLPSVVWVQEIVEACDRAGVKVWEKNNLQPLLNRPLRQEVPWDIKQKV